MLLDQSKLFCRWRLLFLIHMNVYNGHRCPLTYANGNNDASSLITLPPLPDCCTPVITRMGDRSIFGAASSDGALVMPDQLTLATYQPGYLPLLILTVQIITLIIVFCLSCQ
jgi:hypothetical protein